jgi:hypothetical protein
MTHKDGGRNLYEAGIDQVFVIPGHRSSGLVFCRGDD